MSLLKSNLHWKGELKPLNSSQYTCSVSAQHYRDRSAAVLNKQVSSLFSQHTAASGMAEKNPDWSSKKKRKKISLHLSLDDLTSPFRQLKGHTEQVTWMHQYARPAVAQFTSNAASVQHWGSLNESNAGAKHSNATKMSHSFVKKIWVRGGAVAGGHLNERKNWIEK